MDVVRAWKDPEYRQSLSDPPEHPSGTPGLSLMSHADLEAAAGGNSGPVCLLKTFTLTVPAWCFVSLALC
ncbi:mersacidin/lichenicidin family type 2 lantibiotic [Streptomyces sp. NPDC005209]|uniref:mersacidin/lichenicidin family type 2 lantibiotic n=1 Tax=Streptomyces sp. NPDC005209 TaxID=3156715 RepID=UPI0033B77956